MTTTFKPARPIWCAGCGDFGVQQALENSLDTLGIETHDGCGRDRLLRVAAE